MNVSLPIGGRPVTVVSDTTDASMVVSASVIAVCGQRSGHERPASVVSPQAAITMVAPTARTHPKCFLYKTASPVHRRSSECGVNAFGMSSSSVHRASRPSRVKAKTTRCGENSSSTCRQMPQGGVGSSASVAMAIASKLRMPPCYCPRDRRSFRAHRRGIRRVLHVAAFRDAAVRSEKRSADLEVGVRRIRALHGRERPLAQHGDRPGVTGQFDCQTFPNGHLTGNQLWEKGRSPSAKFDPEPFANRGAQIGERRAASERGGIDAPTKRQQRHALARMVR